MGLRFTNPEKWDSPRFRRLSPQTKLVYLYLLENCDLAGILEIDLDRIAFDTGLPNDDLKESIQEFDGYELNVENGFIHIMDFVKDQKNVQTKTGKLNPNDNAHKHIINRIDSRIENFKNCLRAYENLGAVLPQVRVTGKGNDKAIGSGNDYDTSNSSILVWNKSFKCHQCGAERGQPCKLKTGCSFPQNLKTIEKS